MRSSSMLSDDAGLRSARPSTAAVSPPVLERSGSDARLPAASTAFLPFALPDITQAELDAVAAALRSGWVSSGPEVGRFERAFSDFLGGGDLSSVAVNSATAGLHLVLEALGIGPGDEVIVPVHTFTATAEVVCHVGATPVFVDVGADDLTIDPDHVRSALGARTAAILPVHYAGLACAMDPLLDLALPRGVAVVEDAAHALPTTHAGALVGTLESTAAVFSFYATKPITTGEGGMIVTRSAEIARRAKTMRLHGISSDVFDRYRGKGLGFRYEVVAPGFKYNMTDIAASMGLVQLGRAWAMRDARAQIADVYDQAFADLPVRLPARPQPGDVHAWHLYVIRLRDDAPVGRDAFIARMRERDVGCSVHYVPLHMHPFWRERYGLRPEQFPRSTAAYERIVSLPIYSRMTSSDVDHVVDAVRSALAG